MAASLLVYLGALAALVLIWQSQRLKRSKRLPFPPGPKGLPLIGNLFQLPQENAWRFHGTETFEKYGDIAHFSALGSHIIILNSYTAVFDLLSRRSSIYSDRPVLPMLGVLMATDQSTAFSPYGQNWRAHRREWKQHLGSHAIEAGDYASQVGTEARAFVVRLLADNSNLAAQIKLWSVKTLVRSAFGKMVDSMDDEFVSAPKGVADELALAMVPGKYFVDVFPSMLHIPAWFPGAAWKRLGLDVRDRITRTGSDPYEFVKSAMAAGNAPKSFISEMIRQPSASESVHKWIVAGIYIAGVDTTQEAMTRFVASMMAHPDIQRRAQQEIDSVIGSSRLPTIEDKQSLPYVDAVTQEVFRFETIVPFALPHASTQDDEYRGYHIPKGSTVLPNMWAISRDPEQYPNPDKFDPERYLKNDGKEKPLDPRLYSFGVGRRVCPGRHFAELAIYTTITTLLATVNILKPIGADGAEYTPKIEFKGNGLSAMCPFEARLVPRSEKAMALLMSTEDQ